MSGLEWFAAITGLASVVLTARRQSACWPVGLLSVAAYGLFFWRIKLYADSGLQAFFFVSSIYGWWHWTRGGPDRGKALIRILNGRARAGTLAAVAMVAGAIGWALQKHTDASNPFWDALAAVLSVAAQLLLMRKFLDSWFLWIAVDVLSIGLYAVKEAWVTLGLYAVFLVLAIAGCLAWQRAVRRGERV